MTEKGMTITWAEIEGFETNTEFMSFVEALSPDKSKKVPEGKFAIDIGKLRGWINALKEEFPGITINEVARIAGINAEVFNSKLNQRGSAFVSQQFVIGLYAVRTNLLQGFAEYTPSPHAPKLAYAVEFRQSKTRDLIDEMLTTKAESRGARAVGPEDD